MGLQWGIPLAKGTVDVIENEPLVLLTIGYQAPGQDQLLLVGVVLLCGADHEVVAVPAAIDSDERDVVMGMAGTVAQTFLDHGLRAAASIFAEYSNNVRVSEPVVLPQTGPDAMRTLACSLRDTFGTTSAPA